MLCRLPVARGFVVLGENAVVLGVEESALGLGDDSHQFGAALQVRLALEVEAGQGPKRREVARTDSALSPRTTRSHRSLQASHCLVGLPRLLQDVGQVQGKSGVAGKTPENSLQVGNRLIVPLDFDEGGGVEIA
jgi:hypothetical protein